VGAPQTRISELAAGLARRGVQVTVHTAPPHYPDGVIRPPYANRPLHRQRTPDGVRVLRSPVYATPNRGFARRLGNHLSHAASSLATSFASGPCDVLVAESPPLFTAAAGALYAAGRRAALVLNIADLWPASAVELGMLHDRRAIAAAEWLERECYARAAAIVVPTDGMRERLDALPAAAGRARWIPPAVDLARFGAAPLPPQPPLRALYAGTVGLAHGVEHLVEAAALAGPDAVEVTVAGGGAELPAVRAAVERLQISNVALAGSLPAEDVPAAYAGHHAGVVMLRDRPLFSAALPTKLLEVMAAGRAAVVSARGDAAALVERTGSGVAVAPEDPAALAAVLRALAADPGAVRAHGAAGRRTIAAGYDRAAMVDRWLELLEAAARAPRPAQRAFL